jgi:hypothetical protein
MNHPGLSCGLVLALACALCACDRKAPPISGSSLGVTNAQAPNAATAVEVDPDAVEELANSLCARQRSCDRVGTGREYSSFFDCLNEQRGAVRADLASLGCASGVEATHAQQCAAEIEKADCTQPIGGLPTLEPCRGDVLCSK